MMIDCYRIVEEIDGNGQSLFYPEKKGIFGIWFRYHHDCGTVDYSTKEAALFFIKQQQPKKEIIHTLNQAELKGEGKRILRDYAIWQAITDLESRCRHRSSGLQIEVEDKEHEPVVQAALLILSECGVDVVRDAKFPNIKINYDRSKNQFFGMA